MSGARWIIPCVFSFLLAALIGACASKDLKTKPPNLNKAEWIEVKTSHFRLLTDLPEGEARKLATEFHRRAQAMNWVIFRHETLPSFQSRIIAFRRERDFQFFAPDRAHAFMTREMPGELSGQETIVQHGASSQTGTSMFQHRFAHRLILEAFDSPPPWLAEGMALYYAGVSLRNGVVRLGEQPKGWVFSPERQWGAVAGGSNWELAVPISELSPPRALVKLSREEFYKPNGDHETADLTLPNAARYASSWALVSLFLNGPESYQRVFANVLADVAAGKPSYQAVNEHIGRLPVGELEQAFYDHVKAKHWNVWQAELPASKTPSIEIRRLERNELSALWIKLALKNDQDEAADQWLNEALATGPDHPRVWVLKAAFHLRQDDPAKAAAALKRAHARAPESGEALSMLIDLYLRHPEVEPDRDKARRQDSSWAEKLLRVASGPSELLVVAAAFSATGRTQAAESTAKQAIRFDQTCSECFAVLAEIRQHHGDVDAATALQERAISRASQHPDPQKMTELAAQLKTRFRNSRGTALPVRDPGPDRPPCLCTAVEP